MKTSGLFYKERPLFGLDIGYSTIKIVQLERSAKKINLGAFGLIDFNPSAIKNGEIIDINKVAEATRNLIDKKLVGRLSADRIADSLPVLHAFTRIINLPVMDEKDVKEAIELEAEQYIPVPINDLYLDYQLVEKTAESQDFLVSAAPRRVVDSYISLFNQLELDVVALEPSILSVARVVQNSEDLTSPTLVIDFGAMTTDLIIYSGSTVRVTGTIKFGGDTITQAIMRRFNLSQDEALNLKKKHGLDFSDKQGEIVSALAPSLNFLATEIKKIIRYFEERDKDQTTKIDQIIILGGGANMPGFSTFLTSELRIPTRLISVWLNIDRGHIETPSTGDTSIFATATGLALIKPREVVS
jgi:type IV pilus assembly protein PilM